jgi:hypothetical protein
LVPLSPAVPFQWGAVPFGQGAAVAFPARERSVPGCAVALAYAPAITNTVAIPSTVVAIATATTARFVLEFIGVPSWENIGGRG